MTERPEPINQIDRLHKRLSALLALAEHSATTLAVPTTRDSQISYTSPSTISWSTP